MNQQKLGAVVTATTSGIGLAIAQHLAKAGYPVMLNGFGGGPRCRWKAGGRRDEHRRTEDHR